MRGTFTKVSPERLCAKSVRLNRSENGFTLIELMMACGVMAFLFVGVGASVRLLNQSYQDIDRQQAEVLSAAIFGGTFMQVAESSTPSAAYMHAPVAKSCGGAASPCLRKLVDGELKDATGTSISALPSAIQFYRDETGAINTDQMVLKGVANVAEAKYGFSESLPTVKNLVGEQLYATWPLWNASSPELLSLVRSSTVIYKVPYFTALSEVPASSSKRLLLQPISGSTSDTTAASMVGKLMVFSNSDNRKYYSVVKIKNATWCSTAMSLCQAADIVSGMHMGDVGVNDVLLEFEIINTGTLPGGSAYPSVAWQDGVPASSSPLFPTQSINVTDTSMAYLDPGSFHPRKILHYFHSQRITGELVAFPVALVGYSLEVKSAGTYNLKRKLYKFGSSVTAAETTIAGDLTAPVVMARQLGTMELSMFTTTPLTKGETAIDMTKYRVKHSTRAHMNQLTISALSRDPNPINYPRTCEMTFSFQQFCGDHDVDMYYNGGTGGANWIGFGKNQGEAWADTDSTYHLILGYFTEERGAMSADQVPQPEEWYAIGWQDRDAGSTDVGLRQINSNEVRSGNDMLKEEMDMLSGLARYMPADFDVYANAMVCKDFQTADSPPVSGPLPTETDDALDTNVAGYSPTERAWKTGILNVTTHDTYSDGAVAGACELNPAGQVPIGPIGFGTTPGGTLPYVSVASPPTSLGPGCTASPITSYGTVGGVYGVIITYAVTCTTTTAPPPPDEPTVYSCTDALPAYTPKCGGTITCVDGSPAYDYCDPYTGCYSSPETMATITEVCSNGDRYVNGAFTPAPGCMAVTLGACELPAIANLASTSGTCLSGYIGSCEASCSAGTWTTTTNTCAPPPPPECSTELASYSLSCGGATTCQFQPESYYYDPYGGGYPIPSYLVIQEGCPNGTFYRHKRSGSDPATLSGPHAAPTPAMPWNMYSP